MAALTPYTYIQCPCSDSSMFGRPSGPNSPTGAEGDEDDRTFDPRAPRSNYSLYPLEYLLYCEDCHQIRCPRCVSEEIVTYYCPNCLFEVPSSTIKSEGNRCTRSCFQCPVCIGPLAVTTIETKPDPGLLAATDNTAAPHSGPYALTCSYCNWSSTEVGIKFDKPNSIHAQLAKLRNGGTTRLTAKERKERRKDPSYRSQAAIAAGATAIAGSEGGGGPESGEKLDLETQFANLKSFYQRQLADPNSADTGLASLSDLGFSSPASLSRIMSIYTGGSLQDKKAKSRVGAMREALESDEGLQVADLDESTGIEKLQADGHEGTASTTQLLDQIPHLGEAHLHGRGRFVSELRPIPYLLRTKRSKRCPVCRHIISKPEAKIQTTRFRIRLVAGSYIPSIAIRPLSLSSGSSSGSNVPGALLEPLKPTHYLLTFRNPIFETIKVTLGAPATTPGRFPSKVTVLCPEFEIDANTDVWDEALKDNGGSSNVGERGERRRSSRRGQQQQQQPTAEDSSGSGNGHNNAQNQLEVGKIWERGRNWVSIVVEVVPASLKIDDDIKSAGDNSSTSSKVLREDEDVLEIPMFVRVEWESDPGGDEVAVAARDASTGREKRELAYWCVLGLGRIRR
ncbi:dynactin subunit 4 [Chaetomium strumarium]|uniref:Dynactin subunit 4 n=1 Tax=Chaetomium strumarium TaxID=1170767 RepID=A0AAJ0GN40_9PEZI|nr:dynactin subunit 4 [Chaetomium strumarium]